MTSLSIWSWTLELCPFAFQGQHLRTIQTISTAQTSDRSQSDLNRTKPTHLSNRNRTQDHKPPLHSPTVVHPATLSSSLSRLASPLDRSPQSTHALSATLHSSLSSVHTRSDAPYAVMLLSALHCVSLHAPPSLRAARSILSTPPFLYADSSELSISMLALSAIRSLPHAPSTFVSRAIACRRW